MTSVIEIIQNDVPPVTAIPISFWDVLISLFFTSVLSAIMYYTFKNSRSEIVYDSKFNVTLVMIAMVVTLMLQLVGSNLALSVGIMGSLSACTPTHFKRYLLL